MNTPLPLSAAAAILAVPSLTSLPSAVTGREVPGLVPRIAACVSKMFKKVEQVTSSSTDSQHTAVAAVSAVQWRCECSVALV
jgi:hypothetical protein